MSGFGNGLRSALALALALWAGSARADGLLRIANCRIVDDRGPVKAMGVNYVDGFWNFAKDGKREAYLPYLDALAEAKISFIRMAFGPWAAYKPDEPAAPQIADFVTHRDRWFERLDTFLADLKARHIGVVLDVFWNIDPYTVYFGEPVKADSKPGTRTFDFLADTVSQLGRRYRNDPEIWMIEFANEGNLLIDYPKASHTRAELIAQTRGLAAALRAAGDRHIVDTGNSRPRADAEHLNTRKEWKPDSRNEFLQALDSETPVDVASVHIYTEKHGERPWDQDDVLQIVKTTLQHTKDSCKPLFIGEFGSENAATRLEMAKALGVYGAPISAIWGFGRKPTDAFEIGLDTSGRQVLSEIARLTRN